MDFSFVFRLFRGCNKAFCNLFETSCNLLKRQIFSFVVILHRRSDYVVNDCQKWQGGFQLLRKSSVIATYIKYV